MTVREEMVHGVFWTAVKKYSGAVIQLAITAVLSRLLTPQDFGIVAIASVSLNLLSRFSGLGIGSAIIFRQDLSKENLESIFSISVYAGIILAALLFCLAHPIAKFYGNESLVLICGILSVNLLFATWNTIPGALMLKNKRFMFIAWRTLVLQIISGGAAIIAAFKGMGMYALLIPPVFTGCMVLLINYRQYPIRFHWRPGMAGFRKIRSFSLFQCLFNIPIYLLRNLDKLVIGKYFGVAELGYYSKAYNLMLLPMQNIVYVVSPVLLPVLAPFQYDYRNLADKSNKIVRIFVIIGFPLSVFFYHTAGDIVSIVYGDGWAPTIPVFRMLALSLPFQMSWSVTASLFQAAGKTNWLFRRGMSDALFTVLGFIFAAIYFHTLEAMAWAWTAVSVINALIAYVFLYKFVLKQSLQSIVHMYIKTGMWSVLLYVVLQIIISNGGIQSHLMLLIVSFAVTVAMMLLFLVLTGQTDLLRILNRR